jgi:hypothetical protein
LPTGTSTLLTNYNQPATTGTVTVYTPGWGIVTNTIGASVVAVVLVDVSGPPRTEKTIEGRVLGVYTGLLAQFIQVPRMASS